MTSPFPATGRRAGLEVRVVPSPSLQEVVAVARLRVLVGAILAAALVLAFTAPAATAGGGEIAKVRVFHNSPDTPPVDIYVNGAKTLSDVSYGTLGDYLKVPRGTYNVQVKVAPSTASDPAALEADVRLGRRPTTIAAIGSLTGDGGALRLKVLRDRDIVSRYLTRLRVVHTSPDAPAVDVQAKLAGRWVRVVRHLEFGEATGYLLLPAGRYRLRIVAAGANTVVKDLGKVRLRGSTSYTAWAVGFLSPTGDHPAFGVFVSKDG
jgi:hypothetical protein